MRTLPAPPPPARPSSVPPLRSVPYQLLEPDHGSESIPPQRDSGTPSGLWSSPPLDPDAHFRAAELLLERGHCRAAVLEAQKAIRLGPPRPEQRALYAWLLYRRGPEGDPVQDCVWEHLEQALQEDPNCAIAHYFKGVLLKRIGNLEQGRFHLERALELESDG